MKLVSYEVDIQKDFMLEGAPLYVPGCEVIKPNIRSLNKFEWDLTMGSGDSHPENDVEFESFPPHCIKGTKGEERLDGLYEPQVYFKKTRFDVGEEEDFATIFNEYVDVDDTVVIYGVVTEICVDGAVLAILNSSEASIIIITDAIKELDLAKKDIVLKAYEANSRVRLMKTKDFLEEFKR